MPSFSSAPSLGVITKRFIYAQAGVREYWVVEPAGLIERFSGEDLARVEEIRDRLTSSLLPGYELSLAGLFSEPDVTPGG